MSEDPFPGRHLFGPLSNALEAGLEIGDLAINLIETLSVLLQMNVRIYQTG